MTPRNLGRMLGKKIPIIKLDASQERMRFVEDGSEDRQWKKVHVWHVSSHATRYGLRWQAIVEELRPILGNENGSWSIDELKMNMHIHLYCRTLLMMNSFSFSRARVFLLSDLKWGSISSTPSCVLLRILVLPRIYCGCWVDSPCADRSPLVSSMKWLIGVRCCCSHCAWPIRCQMCLLDLVASRLKLVSNLSQTLACL